MIAEFLPRLFLKDDYLNQDDLKELCNLIILDPQWLMTVMKDIVELKTVHGDKEHFLDNTQDADLKKGYADFSVFKIFWEDYVSTSSAITVRHLCLIFQAYCLIYPVDSVNTSDVQKYIIPCKLPERNCDYKSIENNYYFYINFFEFLPDEIYHRLICLAPEKHIIKRKPTFYSKRKCIFFGLLGTDLVIQFRESNQQLIISVL